ncbi:MAG: RNA 2',3'-cyclic phosphodiesterase [Acidimicrobiales bacterium]
MRLFVAVWPSADVLEQVAALPRPDVADVRWTRPDQWHVTLRFLGSVVDADVPDLRAALATAARSVGPVTATAGPSVARFARRILHVPVEGLGGLAAAVTQATARFGEPPEERAFTGHITLARAKGRGRGPDLRPLTGGQVAGEWAVDEVTLVESRLHPGGARYEVVGRFPLEA